MSYTTSNMQHATRIADLEALAAAENITLPFPPVIIADMEAHGHIIDLTTGYLIQNGANQRIYPTTVAEAELFVAGLTGGL